MAFVNRWGETPSGTLHWHACILARLAAAFALAVNVALAAAETSLPSFEVASVKPAPPTSDLIRQALSGRAKIGMSVSGTRVDIRFSSLADLICSAYRIKQYQLVGPDWLSQERFEIQARIPAGDSQDQIPEMLQALLAERFQLTLHRDKKQRNAYALILGKGILRLSESAAPPGSVPRSGSVISAWTRKDQLTIRQDGAGNTAIQRGALGRTAPRPVPDGQVHLEMEAMTMASLAETITLLLDQPALDMTGLKGTYQFSMDLPSEGLTPLLRRSASARFGIYAFGGASEVPVIQAYASPASSSIASAISKLGLKLESGRMPIDVIVVDHVNRNPTEN
jgi:uncharacterized protein (TIGR03435 family)